MKRPGFLSSPGAPATVRSGGGGAGRRRVVGSARTTVAAAIAALALAAAWPTTTRADDAAPATTNDGDRAGAATGGDRSSATGTGALLEQALAAYRQAQETSAAAERPAAFARAERLFLAAAERGPASAALWTNAGTAALQAEHLGTAILAYRRALALDPDDRHAQQNLLHARTLLPAWVPTPEDRGLFGSLVAWQHALSPAERRGGAALAFFLAAAMIAGATVTGAAVLRAFSLVPLAGWLLLLASSWTGPSQDAGVVAASETLARAADSRNAPARFAEPLPPGTEVTIRETRGDWSHVVLADGRDAWVAASAVEPVEQPEN